MRDEVFHSMDGSGKLRAERYKHFTELWKLGNAKLQEALEADLEYH